MLLTLSVSLLEKSGQAGQGVGRCGAGRSRGNPAERQRWQRPGVFSAVELNPKRLFGIFKLVRRPAC